jgi:hypothetical protein
MTEEPRSSFDLDETIATRLDSDTEPDTDTHLQALAILIDADLTDAERADAFAGVISTLLARLSPDEHERFRQIAEDEGELAAMSYLSAVTRPMNEVDRR